MAKQEGKEDEDTSTTSVCKMKFYQTEKIHKTDCQKKTQTIKTTTQIP